jgi:tetratricopeptide (TPR) repeat protein
MNVALSGNFSEYSLPRVLLALKKARAGGTLSVRTSWFTKRIFFQNGNPIFAASTLEDDRLGEMLVKAGKISLQEYEKSVAMLKAGKRLGAILVELGYITPKDLFWGVKYQVKEIMYSLFLLEEGEYEFDEGPLPTHEVITLKISTETLIYEGLHRLNNWTRVKRELPGSEAVLEIAAEYPRTPAGEIGIIDMSPGDGRILALIDGKKSIGEVTAEAHANSFEVMKTLYVLWSLGIAVLKSAPAQGSAAQEEMPAPEKHPAQPPVAAHDEPERGAAVKESPEDTQATLMKEQFERGIEEFKKGDFLSAVERFTWITRGDPRNPRAWSYLSLALSKMPERVKEAEEALLRAIHLDPSNSDHLANLGLLYLKAGLKARAKRQFEKALSLDPENMRAKRGLEQTN